MNNQCVIRLLLCASLLTLSGCASLGPDKVVRDRFDYTAALSESWKDQMLLNMVKLRYGDTPIFLDVASVINSYEMSGSASLGGDWSFRPSHAAGGSFGATGFYANRPTITYNPLSGEKFAKGLMSPIPPSVIVSLIQSGYPADLVFRVMAQSVNGLKNRYGGGASGPRTGDADFYAFAEKVRRIQAGGALGLKVERSNGKEAVLLAFGRPTEPSVEADIAYVKRLLGLDRKEVEFRVVYGLLPSDDKELAILSRNVLQVLGHLGAYIEVPEAHVAEKRASPTHRDEPAGDMTVRQLIRIMSSEQQPADAFLAVPYRQHWFWIDDRDLQSKQIFSFLMFIFTLVESGGNAGAPLVTVPVR